jgi:hypothetical protein
MKKTLVWIAIIAVFGTFMYGYFSRPKMAATITYKDLLKVTQPAVNAIVGSPLILRGEARGSWYFEASFPVKLLDDNGMPLSQTPAQAQGAWMTTEFVPFEATLTFSPPRTPNGTLVLEKDNPSGLPEHDDAFRIPVRFR